MSLKVRENKAALIIEINNQEALVHLDEIKILIDEYVKRGYDFFVFNMAEVKDLTTLGVGSIVAVYKKIKNSSGFFCLVSVRQELKELFHISKVEDMICFYDTEEDAVNDVDLKRKRNSIDQKKDLERKFKRLSCSTKIVCTKSILGKILSFVGETLDISKGGIFVKTSDTFPVGSILNINLVPNESNIDDKENIINAMVRVVWIADKEKHKTHYPGMGLDIINIEEEDYEKLEKFLQTIEAK